VKGTIRQMTISSDAVQAVLQAQNDKHKCSGVVLSLAKTPKEHAEAVEVLFKAFRRYPLNTWIMEGRPGEEVDEMVRFSARWINRACRTNGHIIVARDETSGEAIGAVQFEEKHDSSNALVQFASNFQTGLIQYCSMFFGSTGFPSFMKDERVQERFNAFEHFAVSHKKVIPYTTHHIYLIMIGTDPTIHGKGIGKALLDAMGALADSIRVPIYLETNTERLKGYYERHGYEFKVQFDAPDKVDPYKENFGMLRPAAA
jgi:GNAT superfamily N-acetyltransferase